MGPLTLRRLFVSTAIIAVGFMPWSLSSPDPLPAAFFGAPFVGAGIGCLWKKTALGALVGYFIAITATAIWAYLFLKKISFI